MESQPLFDESEAQLEECVGGISFIPYIKTEELCIGERYNIKKMELWSYNVEKYNNETKTGGIFTDYLNSFIKLMAESSGFPRSNMSQAEKGQYVQNFYNGEGVRLDIENIKENPAMRELAKMAVNTLWGKFIQNNHKMQNKVVKDPQDLFDLAATKNVEISDILPYGEANVWVKWKHESEEYTDPLKHQCLTLVVFLLPEQLRCCVTSHFVLLSQNLNLLFLQTELIVHLK